MVHSLRSWNDEIDVRTIIGTRGAGIISCAGGRTNVDIHLES